MQLPAAIARVMARQNLSAQEMNQVMHAIMSGQATSAQVAGFLVGLHMKGETVTELTSAVQVMRELAEQVPIEPHPYMVDTCGTGGDGAHTFNISTASAFVAAAAGAKVAKHGNRSVSSSTGSADVLEAAGGCVALPAVAVSRCISQVGFGFMFAPVFHQAMKHAIGPRREMGVRTMFNLLGPLTNPARARNQVIGVFAKSWLLPVAEVANALGSEHVLVVHAEDGLDEISLSCPTHVVELHEGEISSYQITPEELGVRRSELSGLTVKSAEQSLSLITSALNGKPGAARDIVTLNAGAAIYAAGLAESLESGVAIAKEQVATGAAAEKLQQWVSFTQKYKAESL